MANLEYSIKSYMLAIIASILTNDGVVNNSRLSLRCPLAVNCSALFIIKLAVGMSLSTSIRWDRALFLVILIPSFGGGFVASFRLEVGPPYRHHQTGYIRNYTYTALIL